MALAAIQRVIVEVTDVAGDSGVMALDIDMNAAADPTLAFATFPAVFNAVSDAVITGMVGQTADNGTVGTALTSPFDIRDKLSVEYVGSQNDHHFVEIGDPNPAIFLADGETVNPANALWIDLKAKIETNVKDKLGNAVTVIKGFRNRSRNLKRKVLPET